MEGRSVLIGICGIGGGHRSQQLPIIRHFARTADVCVFSYGEGPEWIRARVSDLSNVTVAEVSVPFWKGNSQGLDFAATALAEDETVNSVKMNASAMQTASEVIGKPDLVISDYEPNAAAYAYAHDSTFITVDQQSKFMWGEFPLDLNGNSYNDEVMRLRMFFPRAERRIACSFYTVRESTRPFERVEVVPAFLRTEIFNAAGTPKGDQVLVYVTPQPGLTQSLREMMAVLADIPDQEFLVFAPGESVPPDLGPNVKLTTPQVDSFEDALVTAKGVIATAGHALLAEAMHLGTPVYAIPLPVYEHHMSAHVVASGEFGVSAGELRRDLLTEFLSKIDSYASNIDQDDHWLNRGNGLDTVLPLLDGYLHQSEGAVAL